jgi:hypothetical protein
MGFPKAPAIEVGIAPNGRYGLYLSMHYKFYVIGWIVGVVVGDIHYIYNWLLCNKKLYLFF